MRRIIPARAGFTLQKPRVHAQHGDHPRSRGVYIWWRARAIKICGSSPLARGLRCGGMSGLDALRIIPARAGFTYAAIAALCR